MEARRPDPESLLRRARLEDKGRSLGRLKVFLGAAPGVGKTYAMLEEARKLSAQGVDVAVGYVEPHVRPETAALVLGLEIVPPRTVEQSGIRIRDLDIDACLRRKPAVLIVDELAHTNPEGSRHPKRWQDVDELLEAGISVYTTLNVQHIESLKDVVAQITHVIVRETVPDAFLDRADEVEVVDIAPEELLARMKAGKIYLTSEVERALESFFKTENIIALRELALRRTAERVGAQLEDYRQARVESPIWATGDRLLVCVGPSPFSAHLVRATRRMAAGLKAPWLAVHVETPASARWGAAARAQLTDNLRLAEQLGAEVVRLAGVDVAGEIVELARRRNVTKIVVGKPLQPRWREVLRGSFVYELTRRCGAIDVYVISGEGARQSATDARTTRRPVRFSSYAWATVAVLLSTAVCFAMFPYLDLANLTMVYLLGVLAIAARGERGPAVLTSVLGVLAFDFCFVPPRFSLNVSDAQYLITFAAMLLVSLLISGLTVRLRLHAEWARERENATAALYTMSRALAAAHDRETIVREVAAHLASIFEARVALLLPDAGGRLEAQPVSSPSFIPDEREMAVARWAFDHGKRAGLGTETLPAAAAMYQPLRASGAVMGVAGLQSPSSGWTLDAERIHLLETLASQVALVIERATLAARARESEMQVEAERLRSSLLSSVSHDLRTPLASILGSSSMLAHGEPTLPAVTRRELVEAIYDEAERLNRLVGNLLEATRLEGGAVEVKREWLPLEEIVGVVLNRLARLLADRPCTTQLPASLPLVPVDPALLEQAMLNLVENAARHTPPRTPIEIGARLDGNEVTVWVADRGPGVPTEAKQPIFERFRRLPGAAGVKGVGLGLAISGAVVKAHGGRIWVEDRPGGGALFLFTLPLAGAPPLVPSETSP